jgi:hypothetical protein
VEAWQHANAESRRQARRLEHDEWEAYLVSEAAAAAGKWLEQKTNLGRPIASLTKRDLECIAQAVIGRWIVLASHRIAERPQESDQYASVLMG